MEQTHSPLGALARIGLDLGLTATLLLLFSFGVTGLTLHEWLGVALCVLVPVHMLVSWRWLAAITSRLFSPLPWRTRVTYLLNAGLFVSLVVVTLSGLVISEVVLRGVLPQGSNRAFWRMLHTQSANATLLLMAIHLGIYGRQLVGLVRRAGSTVWARWSGRARTGADRPRPTPRPATPVMAGRS